MRVDIERVVRRGFERTTERNGLQFVGVFYLLAVLNRLLSDEVVRWIERSASGPPWVSSATPATLAPSLGIPPGVAGGLLLALAFGSLVVTAVALRTLVSDETERVPRAFATRRMGYVLLNLVVGSVLFVVALTVGFALLVLPGFFLLVSLYFWAVVVAVEDESFLDGFERSWNLTSGRRLWLFVLGVVVVVINVVIGLVFGIPGALLPASLEFLVTELGNAVGTVFVLAATGEAYRQLTDSTPEVDQEEAWSEDDPGEWSDDDW